jgi:putative glutamine amidotransferase
MSRTPLVAVPGRFSASASALRYAALVNARGLLDGIRRADGRRSQCCHTPGGGRRRDRPAASFADAVLLPEAATSPTRYRQPPHAKCTT